MIALREDFGKGSVRTFAGKDVLAALRASAQTLKAFGGHKHAAGLSLELDQVDAFTEAFDQTVRTLGGFLEQSHTHVQFLAKKATLVEEYLKQR